MSNFGFVLSLSVCLATCAIFCYDSFYRAVYAKPFESAPEAYHLDQGDKLMICS